MIYNIFNNNLLDIINYEFPEVVKKRAKEELGITDERTFNLVEISLKDYFYVIRKNLKKNKKFKLEMLDRPADVLWHNFILDTKSYSEFCNNYIGHFIHHKPYVEAKELSKSELEKIENYYSEVFKSIYISTDFKLFSSIRKDKEYVEKRNKIIKNNTKITLFKNLMPYKKIMFNHQKTIYKNYLSKFNFNVNENEILFSSLNYEFDYLGTFINKMTVKQLEVFIKMDNNDYILSNKEFEIIENILLFFTKNFIERLEQRTNRFTEKNSGLNLEIFNDILSYELSNDKDFFPNKRTINYSNSSDLSILLFGATLAGDGGTHCSGSDGCGSVGGGCGSGCGGGA